MGLFLYVLVIVAWAVITFKWLDKFVEGKWVTEEKDNFYTYQVGTCYGVTWCLATSVLMDILGLMFLT